MYPDPSRLEGLLIANQVLVACCLLPCRPCAALPCQGAESHVGGVARLRERVCVRRWAGAELLRLHFQPHRAVAVQALHGQGPQRKLVNQHAGDGCLYICGWRRGGDAQRRFDTDRLGVKWLLTWPGGVGDGALDIYGYAYRLIEIVLNLW